MAKINLKKEDFIKAKLINFFNIFLKNQASINQHKTVKDQIYFTIFTIPITAEAESEVSIKQESEM